MGGELGTLADFGPLERTIANALLAFGAACYVSAPSAMRFISHGEPRELSGMWFHILRGQGVSALAEDWIVKTLK